ncbi:5-oxoprolinase subunit PxpA [Ichthyenterobacterium sp. W332]|uniref:5-oxoprolinase subunit PxpA n=1 Tax=Microcosmobacter mediterraneus TaxID=3075607 RepID=A0ABU2YLQ2_9FLAO|nr:5-oxoprolinase subunit PxpA [Ichthyenterobacterium sp. W332]MDT0558767.1 5-oxoprolinase subunit PxpA [Ichthyenterobacterium sp. W332]
MKIIDINADVGEGVGDDALLIPLISSCNIACGGHAGNEESMRETVELAKRHHVKIGAHPSFPDKANFGRVIMDISCANLYTSLKQQTRNLIKILNDENLNLHHIKPHGALYNLAAKDEKIALVIIEVIKSIAMPIKLYAPYNSEISKLALKENISVTYEAFIDRTYNDDLSLVERSNINAVITNKEDSFNHLLRMVKANKVKTILGLEQVINAETYCIHGDTNNALEILKYIHSRALNANIRIQ